VAEELMVGEERKEKIKKKLRKKVNVTSV